MFVNKIGTIGFVIINIVFEHAKLVHGHPERAALHFVVIENLQNITLAVCFNGWQPPVRVHIIPNLLEADITNAL